MKRIFWTLVLLTLTPSIYADGWRLLSAEEAKELIADSTQLGGTWVAYTADDGTTIGEWGGVKYRGTYYINDKAWYCSKYTDWKAGKEGCWSVEEKKGKYRMKPMSGRASKTYRVKIKRGNAKKL